MRRARHKSRRTKTADAETHLLSFGELRRIAERILKLSDTDETEVTIDAGADALTRFANNTIHQHVAEQFLTISVRTVLDGRTARATTNKTDEDALRRVVVSSSRIARSQPKYPGLLPMPRAQKYAKVKRWFDATAAASPRDRASAVARICRRAAQEKQVAAGTYSSGATRSLLANSQGLAATYEQTRAEFSVTMMEEKSSGWAKASAADIRALDVDALAANASQKAANSRTPRELAPGRYTVILEPAAALDMVGFLFYDFAGTAVLDKRSCLNERMGKKILGENIVLWDDVTHPEQLGAPFDGEGMPRQKVLLMDRGVPKNLVYSRSTAKKMKAKATGHGLALPNEWGEAPMNLVLEGGRTSIDEMISSTERGILVTRLWYIREVDPYEKIMTGMTRDGTFLVENGRVTGGIRNFRFNQSILELLANVEALGPAARASGEEASDMVIPAMKVRDFHFSAVTKF